MSPSARLDLGDADDLICLTELHLLGSAPLTLTGLALSLCFSVMASEGCLLFLLRGGLKGNTPLSNLDL